MSTRVMFTIVGNDDEGTYRIYKHHDGYPRGAVTAIEMALLFAWKLPRFEADEFAAAFVAGNKLPYWLGKPIKEFFHEQHNVLNVNAPSYAHNDQGGEIRILPTGEWNEVAPNDIEYHYIIGQRGETLYVTAYAVIDSNKQKELFTGTFGQFKVWAAKPKNSDEDASNFAKDVGIVRVPVTGSKMFKSVGYSLDHRNMDLEFSSGKVYRYFGVNQELYKAFSLSHQKGKYYNEHIKDIFEFQEQ